MKRICIGMAALLLSALSTNGDDWTTWRGPNGMGVSAEKDWNPKAVSSLKIKWEATLGNGFSSVTVEGDRLYTMGNINNEDIVYCLDANTGNVKWKHSYKCKAGNYKGPRSTPVIHDKVIFTVSRNGKILCLNKTTGKVIWTAELEKLGAGKLGWGQATSAVVYNDLVLFGAGKAGMAFNIKTGKKVWGSAGTGNRASVMLTTFKGKDLALIWGKEHLFGVNPKTGAELWSYPWITKYDCNAADALPIGDDKIFISSDYNRGCTVIDISSGKAKKVWENQNLMTHFNTAIFLNGCLFGFDGNVKKGKNLVCLDPKNGKVKWKKSIGYSSMSAVNDKLLVLTEEGTSGTLRLIKASPSGYKELAAKATKLKKPCWTSPVLSNGTIYCRDSKGTLIAVDVSK